MITAPLHFSKCPPLAAMHFTALAFMSHIGLLTITGSICATSFLMLACSSLKRSWLEWRGLYTLDLRYSQRQKHLITFHKIPMTSQVSLVSEYTFYENGRRWIWFHNSISCLIWICQNGVIGFLTINKAMFDKRKFFLRHPVDMAFERTNNCLRDTINGIWATEKWFWWIIYGTWAIEQKFWGDQNTITSLRSPQILLVPQPWLPQLLISRTGPGLIQS